MRPVSVVAKPTFGSSRWIGPESVAENGAAVAVGDAGAEGDALGGLATALALGVADGLGAGAAVLPAQAVTSSAMRPAPIRMRRPYRAGPPPA
ncbi:MAG TPA: hypothetical protein VGT60_06580 [Candidatus Limnocylindria bacterium]|nr:hypothetical protein [Candidatus Limnocylindria bacterium]